MPVLRGSVGGAWYPVIGILANEDGRMDLLGCTNRSTPGITGPVQVQLSWRDRAGQPHQQTLRLTPGNHVLQLDKQVEER